MHSSFSLFTRRASRLGLAALGLLAVFPAAAHAQTVLTFDNLPSEPGAAGAASLGAANNGSSTYDGVTFSPNAFVLGSQFGGTSPFVTPHSGNYAFAANDQQMTTLTTTQTLDGLYLGLINDPAAAASVTVNALGVNGIVLGSATDNLTSTTLSYFNTSSLAQFSAVPAFTGYSLVSSGGNGYDFAGDDFTFGPVSTTPTAPPSVNANFDFDTDSVGTSGHAQGTATAFSDVSNGVTANFSSPTASTNGGTFIVEPSPVSSNFGFSGNALLEVSTQAPLSVTFNQTLAQGSVDFAASNETGTLTIQEMLNGVNVGAAVTSSTPGAVSFGGALFNGLTFSNTSPQFAIDNLDVTTPTASAAPEPAQTAGLAFAGLGLGGLLVKARRRRSTTAAA